MAYDAYFGERITKILEAKRVDFFSKPMMGGLLFMMDQKMLCGIHFNKSIEGNLLMLRIGEEAYVREISKAVCLPMDFTGRPMKGYIFITEDGYDLDDDLEYWIALAVAFNPFAKQSPPKKKKSK